jgi:transcriptional regulator with XRE-family HTH domain
MEVVDFVRFGRIVRTLRIKRRWRQSDLAARARVGRAAVSMVERGRARDLRLDLAIRIVEALGGTVTLQVQWQGGDLGRLLNARHSALHESVASYFTRLPDWTLAPEVSFSIRGERGIIDILAWHAPTRTLLVIELKTEIVDVNELMGTADRKRRLATEIGWERGWHPLVIATWLIVADGKTNRRRVAAHGTTLRNLYPADGRSINSWLRNPAGTVACLSFWTDARNDDTNRDFATVKRVRRAPKVAA